MLYVAGGPWVYYIYTCMYHDWATREKRNILKRIHEWTQGVLSDSFHEQFVKSSAPSIPSRPALVPSPPGGKTHVYRE